MKAGTWVYPAYLVRMSTGRKASKANQAFLVEMDCPEHREYVAGEEMMVYLVPLATRVKTACLAIPELKVKLEPLVYRVSQVRMDVLVLTAKKALKAYLESKAEMVHLAGKAIQDMLALTVLEDHLASQDLMGPQDLMVTLGRPVLRDALVLRAKLELMASEDAMASREELDPLVWMVILVLMVQKHTLHEGKREGKVTQDPWAQVVRMVLLVNPAPLVIVACLATLVIQVRVESMDDLA